MSTTNLATLLEELLDEIATFLDVDDGPLVDVSPEWHHNIYGVLSLTCKSLRTHFQHRLFSKIYLSSHIYVDRLLELVLINPVLPMYIRTVQLEMDGYYKGMFRYLPLLAILNATTPPGNFQRPRIEIHLHLGLYGAEYPVLPPRQLPIDGLTHISNAPPSFLDAVTHLSRSTCRTLLWKVGIPIGILRSLMNLKELNVRDVNIGMSDYYPGVAVLDGPRPKPEVFIMIECRPATIDILSGEILDLSRVKKLGVIAIKVDSDLGASERKMKVVRGLLEICASTVETVIVDADFEVSSAFGPLYDLALLPNLRQCHFTISAKSGTNPIPNLCNLLRTLPPLEMCRFQQLHLVLTCAGYFYIPPPTEGTDPHIVWYSDAWREFDDLIVRIATTGTRPLKLALDLVTRPIGDITENFLKDIFRDWERKCLPRSSTNANVELKFQYHIF